MNVLEISPWEPPASGWTTRIRLLRKIIEQEGGRCEILDIGPSRRVTGRDCVPVMSGPDYIKKVLNFTRQGFVVHGHANGHYFRGSLLMLCAAVLARLSGAGFILTFHGGHIQPAFSGLRRVLVWPVYSLLFALSFRVICNSPKVKQALKSFAGQRKFVAIPAFSKQYMEFNPVTLETGLEDFCVAKTPLIVSYLCFRPVFSTETVLDCMRQMSSTRPDCGLVIVGTGDEEEQFRRQIADLGLTDNIHIAGDLGHDAFLTLVSRCRAMIRTPVSDGVSATVLEALALGIPVIASENGARPDGVISYEPGNENDLRNKLEALFTAQSSDQAAPVRFEPRDTAREEVDLIARARR